MGWFKSFFGLGAKPPPHNPDKFAIKPVKPWSEPPPDPVPANDYNLPALRRELIRDEGRRKKPYHDSEGILTIGVGWNLEANGLPDEIIDSLLEIAITTIAVPALNKLHPAWRELHSVRQRVLLNMAFNLGHVRLKKFYRMWSAIRNENYPWAAREMMDSTWAEQVGPRAKRLQKMMRNPEKYKDAA